MTPEERAAMLRAFAAMADVQAARLRLAAACELTAESVRRWGVAYELMVAADDIANSDDGEFENRVTDMLEDRDF